MFSLSDYNFDLPERLIAQEPVGQRDQSRLLYLNKTTGSTTQYNFSSIIDLLTAGDVLVVNNTKVIPARLFGRKKTGGKVEILITNYSDSDQQNSRPDQFDNNYNDKTKGKIEYECLIKASKSPKPGTIIDFGPDLQGKVTAVHERTCTIEFFCTQPFDKTLDKLGVMPLPPYIKRKQAADRNSSDRENYQTVYATHKGAVAAPTAGLHFSENVLNQLNDKGVLVASITLHVGYGTFMPIRVQDIRQHRMHSEHLVINDKTAKMVNAAKTDGRRIVAVGTTSVRTLEYICNDTGHISAASGSCDLFIYPGYDFRCVDAMITNFHLPQSTLIMLVSAFAGRENILKAYNEAIKEEYRFFSYGDAMIIA